MSDAQSLGNLPLPPGGQAFVDPKTGNLQPAASYFLRVIWQRTGSATGGIPASQLPASVPTTAYVNSQIAAAVVPLAPLMSPAFTGDPEAPTPPPGDNSTAIATTAFVQADFASPPAIGATAPAAGAFTTLNASANDALLYTNGTTQSIPTGTYTAITGWTKVFDRVNAHFNATTGLFTAAAAGYYEISGQVTLAASTPSAINASYAAAVVANGVTVAQGYFAAAAVASAAVVLPVPRTIVALAAGQTLGVQVFQQSTTATPLAGVASLTFLSINRLA